MYLRYGAISWPRPTREGRDLGRLAPGGLVWTSYCGGENGTEATCLEGPVDAAAESERTVSAHFVAIPHGVQFPQMDHVPSQAMRFEVVDADTIVMVDPQKGRLVFHRKS